MIVAEPVLLKSQSWNEVTRGVGNKGEVSASIPKKCILRIILNEKSIGRKIKRLARGEAEHLRPWQPHNEANIPKLRIGNLSRHRLLADRSLISGSDRLLGLDPSSVLLGKTLSRERQR